MPNSPNISGAAGSSYAGEATSIAQGLAGTAATQALVEQLHPSSPVLGFFEQLPADLLASYIWAQLPGRDRKRLRQACRGWTQYAATELMRDLKVLVCRASLLQLTAASRTLHQRFPHPASLELRLLPPGRRDDGAAGASGTRPDGASGCGAEEGWFGSTAVMSFFLSELGTAMSVTSLSLQGWQELSARDLHHVVCSYPRLTRLHLAGLHNNNYLAGSSLESLERGRCGGAGARGGAGHQHLHPRSAASGPQQRPQAPCGSAEGREGPAASHALGEGRASAPCGGGGLVELVVDTQLLMEPQAALESLSRLPRLSSLQLTGVPLLPCAGLPALSRLTGLTRLELTFEHKHAASEAQLGGLAALTGLRHLGLDFMQLGTGSSLWSAGWLLSTALRHLTRITALHLPRAFLYDKSHPAFLQTLAALPHLTDLALGSIILSPETAAAAAGAPSSPLTPSRMPPPEAAGRKETTGGEAGADPARPDPSGAAPSTLVRPWRRLALGAAMPCYLEALLPLLLGGDGGGGGDCDSVTVAAAQEEGRVAEQPAASPRCGGRAGGGGTAVGCGDGGGLQVLELSTPCTLQMVQALPRFVRPTTGTACSTTSNTTCAAAAAATATAAPSGGGAGGLVREVRLMLRLSANWREVLAAAAAVGPALKSLALLPTYLYGSGTMMTPQVVSAVASSLPHLEHLELHRLNTDPWDVNCLADMTRLRFVLLGVAAEARERRGAAHPEGLVRSLLAALHAKRSGRRLDGSAGGERGSSGCGSSNIRNSKNGAENCRCGGAVSGGAGSNRTGSISGFAGGGGVGGGSSSGGGGHPGVVICCPELSEEEAARLDELCELEYGTYDMHGSRLWVERATDGTLPWRLAVGSSLAPGRWRP